MLSIRFLPESDLEDYTLACREYAALWRAESERIVSSWKSITGLSFRETHINAVVLRGISRSHPLSLRFDLEPENKRATLIHELGHRLLADRIYKDQQSSLELHKTLFLVLPDVYLALGGQALLETALSFDRALPRPEYREAWEWALALTSDARKREFANRLK